MTASPKSAIQNGFHHRGHRGHGEQTEKKLWVKKQGSVISTRASRSAFLCGLCSTIPEILRDTRRFRATGVPPVLGHGRDGHGTALVAAPPRRALRGESFLRGTQRVASWLWLGSAAFLLGLMFMPGCGSSSSTTTTTTTTPPPVANSIAVAVNAGPANNAVNAAYVSVEVCNPGGTTTCATIPDVLVDTGSSGLRILASAPGVSSLTFTPEMGSGSPVYECVLYADGNYLWGQVEQADVSMAGENATSVPIQVIAGSAPSITPCGSSGGSNLDTSTALQANGILGIGTSIQDCGSACTGSSVPPYYWLCPSSSVCTSAASVLAATQVSNPVAFFNGSDNNGVVLTMNSLGTAGSASGAATASGTLYFGIGTQSDNALSSSVKVYALSLNAEDSDSIFAIYNTATYPAYVDSALYLNFFLDPATVAAYSAGAGISNCQANNGVNYYCTSPALSLSFTAQDTSGDSASQTLSIGNGATLYDSSVAEGGSNTAFSNLAGGGAPANDEVILGMPFFYGKTVYVGIAGKVAPSGVPASAVDFGYWAF